MLRLSLCASVACATSLLLSQTALAAFGGTTVPGGGITTVNASSLTISGAIGSNVHMPEDFTSGTVKLVDDRPAGDKSTLLDIMDTALVDYQLSEVGGELFITATPRSAATTASELGVSTGTASALANANSAVANDSAALNALTSVLNAGSSAFSPARFAAEQLSAQPMILESSLSSMVHTGVEVFNVAANRLASLRYNQGKSGSAQTGFSSGDMLADSAMWVQTFGNLTKKDDTTDNGATSYGYDATTYGLAVGMDTDFTKNINAGLSFAYSQTDVDGNGPSDAQNDINSYQVTAYGDYTARYVFVNAMLGYAFNTNDTERVINFGGLNRVAMGDYNSNQYMAGVKAGLPMHISKNTMLRPALGLSYTRVSTDSYTETGAGGLNQSVTPDDIDVLLGSFDLKLVSKVRWGTGLLLPEASIGVNYDFVGDEATATGRYAGGGSTFTVEGAEVEQFGGTLGLGLGYKHQRWTVGVNYDAEIKSDYLSQTGKMEVRYAF